MIRRSIYFLLFLLSVTGILVGGGWYWYNREISPAGSGTAEIDFVILKDESAASILSRLQAQRLIRSAFAAKLFLRFNGGDKKMSPGSFRLTPTLSTQEVIRILSRGPRDLWVTIPEGWRREQIGARFASILNQPDSTFDFDEFMTLSVGYEGRLFPDTYLISPTASTSAVISLLTNTFQKKTGLGDSQTDRSVLIVASLIEREVKLDQDRGVVSGIIYKRLENDWPLQLDATVQYAMDTFRCRSANAQCDWWQPIFETKFNSAFNTYQNTGLPPTPICSPGLASITAARSPVSTPYWYYLTGQDGVTYYAETLTEHNSNVDKYLKH